MSGDESLPEEYTIAMRRFNWWSRNKISTVNSKVGNL
jgi:hypothetical protein